MDKTGVYKLYKNEKYGVLLGSVTSNWSVNVNSFFFFVCLFVLFCFVVFCSGSTSAFYFLTLVLGACENRKNRSVWISVLCRHKFHLLQINSSKISPASFCVSVGDTKGGIMTLLKRFLEFFHSFCVGGKRSG